MKACPSCGRENTIHNTNGRQTCYGCDPPIIEDLTLVKVEADGREYWVTQMRKQPLEDFVKENPPEKGKINIRYDTGRCGNQTMANDERPVAEWLTQMFGAFPISDGATYKRHYHWLEQQVKRAQEDAKK